MTYLMELNQNLANWLVGYMHQARRPYIVERKRVWLCFQSSPCHNTRTQNKIPDNGRPEEVSGDDFLRALLCLGEQRIVNPYTQESLTIDPRSLAQRILEIRAHLAKEWHEDIKFVREENADMLREALQCSLTNMLAAPNEDMDDDGRPIAKTEPEDGDSK